MPSKLAALRAFWATSTIGLHLILFGQLGITQALGFMNWAGQLTFTQVDLPRMSPSDKLLKRKS
jgi:hypothetical protein